MTTNIGNLSPFLRTTRQFPEEIGQLVVELNRSYTDIATNVNSRTIGLFTVNKEIIGGESWFVNNNKKQQVLRKVFTFDDATLSIAHGINLSSLTNFVRLWGTFYDGTFWQALPYVDVVDVTNQVGLKISSTQIIVTKGAGAPPTISKGIIVLEWISNTLNLSNV